MGDFSTLILAAMVAVSHMRGAATGYPGAALKPGSGSAK